MTSLLENQSTFARSYERDGFFIHADPVLGADLITRAGTGLEAVRNGVYETGEAPHGREWNPGDNPHALAKIEQPQLSNLALREAIASSRLGEIAAAATGAQKVQVWWVQGLYKPGVSTNPTSDQGQPAATNVGWHQDRFYWDAWEEGSELFTAWLALSDVTSDAGPMVFVPGSHRWGLLEGGDFFSQDQDALKNAIQVPSGEEWREVQDVLPPGGFSLHHQLLIHGSHANRSNAPRRSLAIHLCTQNARPKPGGWVDKFLDRSDICPVIFER